MKDCSKPRAEGARDFPGSRGRRHGRRGRGTSAGDSSGSFDSSETGRIVYVGGDEFSMGNAGVESSQPIGPTGFVSGTTRMSSADALPLRQVTLGNDQDFSAGEVPVDRSGEHIRADLSLPGSAGSCMARVILDSGSELTSVGEGLVTQMFTQFGEDRLQIPFENGPQTVLTATGLPVKVTHKTVPIAVSLRTPWGAVEMTPITFAVRPGNNNVVVFGRATMKELGIDLYPMAMEKLRPRAVPVQFVEPSPCYLPTRRIYFVPPDAFREEAAPADVAVERSVDRESDRLMDPAEEQGAKDRALENSVQQAERSLSAEGAHRLRDSLARRVDTFHGALRGDPPARVEPGVQPQPQVKAEKAKSHRCDPVKTGWLALRIAALVALGLLYCSMQEYTCICLIPSA